MKRTLAILFAALLVLSLTACGGNAGNGDATEPAVSGDETAQSDETVSAAPSGRPSVRKELEALRRAEARQPKPREPQKTNYPEHKNPGKKERRTHHEHQPR